MIKLQAPGMKYENAKCYNRECNYTMTMKLQEEAIRHIYHVLNSTQVFKKPSATILDA